MTRDELLDEIAALEGEIDDLEFELEVKRGELDALNEKREELEVCD